MGSWWTYKIITTSVEWGQAQTECKYFLDEKSKNENYLGLEKYLNKSDNIK